MKKTILLPLLLSLFSTVHATDFVAAKIEKNKNPSQATRTPNLSRLEGWTYLSYVIDKIGIPQHIAPIYSSHNDRHFDESIEYVKNLTEQAALAWLYSTLYYMNEDWYNYRDNVLVAHMLREYLSADLAIKNTQNLLQWQMFKHQYADALKTLSSLQHIEGADLTDDVYNAMLEPMIEIVRNTSNIEVETQLSKTNYWLHTLARSNLSLSALSGNINNADIRCDNFYYSFKVDTIESFDVPLEYTNCKLFIHGSSDTQVRITESGELRDI